MTYEQHPLSAAFPAMGEDDWLSLKDSIENCGVLNPITLFEGMVIDGWHRYRAATDLNMPCPSVDLAENVDPRDFVLAQNKSRRHITSAQLATATASVWDWQSAHRPIKSTPGVDLKTSEQLAEMAGVHVNTITQAKAVLRSGAPELVAAVKAGELGLRKASAISKMPQSEQAAAIHKPMPKFKAQQEAEHEAEDAGPSAEEDAYLAERAQQFASELHVLLDADEPLKLATEKWKQAQSMVDTLQLRIHGLRNENAELVRTVKYWRRQAEKAAA